MLNFVGETLDGTDFGGGLDAPDSLLDACSMIGCSFEGNFERSSFLSCKLKDSEFIYSSLANIKLYESDLEDAKFDTSDLTGANFTSVKFDSEFLNCDLEGASFEGCYGEILIEGSDFVGGEVVSSPNFFIEVVNGSLKQTKFLYNDKIRLNFGEASSSSDLTVSGGEFRGDLFHKASVKGIEITNATEANLLVRNESSLLGASIKGSRKAYTYLSSGGFIGDLSISDCPSLQFIAIGKANSLKIENSTLSLDVVDSEMTKMVLEGSEVRGSLKDSSVKDSTFSYSEFTKFYLIGSKVNKCTLDNDEFKSCSFRVEFTDSTFRLITSEKNDLSRSKYTSCSVSHTISDSDTYDFCYFNTVTFESSLYKKSSFVNATFYSCVFKKTFFNECDLTGASFVNCTFHEDRVLTFLHSDLSKANFK